MCVWIMYNSSRNSYKATETRTNNTADFRCTSRSQIGWATHGQKLGWKSMGAVAR